MEAPIGQPAPLPTRSTVSEAGEPATVELDLTTSPESWERSPSHAADPSINRSAIRLDVNLAWLLRFGFEIRDHLDRQMKATLQFVLLVVVVFMVGAGVWHISRSVLVSILASAIVLATGIVFIRTAPRAP